MSRDDWLNLMVTFFNLIKNDASYTADYPIVI